MAPSEDIRKPSVSFASGQSATWPLGEMKTANCSNGTSNGIGVKGLNGVHLGWSDSGPGDSTGNPNPLKSPSLKSPSLYSGVGDEDIPKDQSHRVQSWGPHQSAASGPQSRARANIHT